MLKKLSIMFICLMAFQLSLAETIYKGVDKAGDPVFSDTPINNGKPQSTINITDDKPTAADVEQIEQQQSKDKQYNQELNRNAEATIKQRQDLVQQINIAEAELKEAQASYDQAYAVQQNNFNNCLSYANNNCEAEDISAMTANLSLAKQKLQGLQIQLNSLPK